VNCPVKCAEMSSPRVARLAISSADGTVLDILGISLLFLPGRLPGRHQMIVLAIRIMPDLENHCTKPSSTPTYRTELLRNFAPPVHDVRLLEDFLSVLETDTMVLSRNAAFAGIKLDPHG